MIDEYGHNLFDLETRTVWPNYCKSWVLTFVPSVTLRTTCQFLGLLLFSWQGRVGPATIHGNMLCTPPIPQMKQVRTRVWLLQVQKSDVNFQFAFLIVFVSWVKNYIYKSRRASNLNFSWLRWLLCFDFHRLIRCIPQGLWLPKAKRYLHQCLRPAAQVGTWKTWDAWKLGPRRLNKWASSVLQVWRTKDIELYIIYSRNV